ncbi:MAG: hypothetical protein HZC25_01770 [Rhodospirillales bacterium]|nr:hypothetical protein [Rhodospirillales bacterium]
MIRRAWTRIAGGIGVAALVFLASAAFAQGELVILSVTGLVLDLREGQSVAAGATIRLPAASTVRLLAASGKVVTVQGPFAGPVPLPDDVKPAESGTQGLARLARFLIERPQGTEASLGAVREVSLGAVRLTEPARPSREPSDPWQVVAEEAGAQCARPPEIVLWRKNAGPAAPYEMRAQPGPSVKAVWPEGEYRQSLRPEFAVDGMKLQVTLGGRASAITLHLLPPALTNPVDIANWMLDKGCHRQAALYLEKLP